MQGFENRSSLTLVPLFPLPGRVLFPGVVIPLHVFEFRYREMMDAVLEGDRSRRSLAMALLKPGHGEMYGAKSAPIFDVVCVGRVLEYERLPDGRYNLMLFGQARARVIVEDRSLPYRRADLAPIPTNNDLSEEESARVVETIGSLLREREVEAPRSLAVFEKLVKAGAEVSTLVDLLTYYLLPRGDCQLQQRVLEEPAIRIRSRILIRWLRLHVEAAKRKADKVYSDPPPMNMN